MLRRTVPSEEPMYSRKRVPIRRTSRLGTVTVKDSRGKLHIIGDVEPEKMEGVTLGTTAVLIYTEALALTLEKKAAAQ